MHCQEMKSDCSELSNSPAAYHASNDEGVTAFERLSIRFTVMMRHQQTVQKKIGVTTPSASGRECHLLVIHVTQR